MKKLLFAFLPSMLLCACGGTKISPEDEVRNYGKYFVEKVTAHQLDSLTNTYPDISKADSIVPIKSDTIIVAEIEPGKYDITLTDGISLRVNRLEDGNISVTESKGLFAYADDKVDIAKKTGMWDSNLSDVSLNERMKDDEFFKHIKKIKTKDVSKILTGGKFNITKLPAYGMDSGNGYFTLTNHSDKPIKGSEYKVLMTHIDERFGNSTWQVNGKDIPANGSIKFTASFHGHTMAYYFKGIKWLISNDELQKKFSTPYTGKEYQEYLGAKK